MAFRGISPMSWFLHITLRQTWRFPSENRKTGSQGRWRIQTERPRLRKLLRGTLAPNDEALAAELERTQPEIPVQGQSLPSLITLD